MGGSKITETFDMVVLATGMQPTATISSPARVIPLTDDGFVDQATLADGHLCDRHAQDPR